MLLEVNKNGVNATFGVGVIAVSVGGVRSVVAGDTGSVVNLVAVVLLVTYYNAHQRVEKMAAVLLPVSEL